MRFPISYGRANRVLFTVMGLGPAQSGVEVGESDVRVWLGWGFRARFPRAAVQGAVADTGRVGGWGAHGWRGTWLVNGSSRGLVRIELSPRQRARVMGLRFGLSVLRVSVEDPDGLLAALE